MAPQKTSVEAILLRFFRFCSERITCDLGVAGQLALSSWLAIAGCGAGFMQICIIHILILTPWTSPDAVTAKVYLISSL